MIRLQTLGALDLRLPDGTPADEVLAQPKRLAVLIYLAAAVPPGFHRRDKLISLFWPDAGEDRARNGLSKALHFLRHHLGEDTVLTRGPDDIAINRDRVWCDAIALEDRDLTIETLLTLYRGDFADAFSFVGSSDLEHWVDGRRTHLRRLAVRAAWTAAELIGENGNRPGAIDLLVRAVQWDPLDEQVTRTLMRQYSRSGNRAAAIAVYQELARRMRSELGARPSAETRELAEVLRQTPPDAPSAI